MIGRFIFLLLATYYLLPTVLWACPLCKEALLDPGQAAAQSGVARGYALSIAALLGVPVVLMGLIAWRIVQASRRAHD